jgi:hypothetical protein|tara:strand:+ start:2476 stop:2886 length:411 start_codon:yes stop_codon:yes gene_type:complete
MSNNKKSNLVRKSIETITEESKLMFNSMPFIQDSGITLNEFIEKEIDRHASMNLIKGTRANKALEMINAITSNNEKLSSIKNLDKISNKLESLVKTVNFLNNNKQSMKLIGKLIGYNFKLVNLNWNSEKVESNKSV